MTTMFRVLLAVAGALLLAAAPASAQRQSAAAGPFRLAGNGCADTSSSRSVVLDVSGMGSASVVVGGTYGGTITWTVSAGGDYVGVAATEFSDPTTTALTTTGTGTFTMSVGSALTLRACMSSYSSGAAVIFLSAAASSNGSASSAGGAGDLTTIETNTGTTATNTTAMASDTAELAAAINSSRVDVNIATVGGNTPTTEFAPDLDSGAGTVNRAAVAIAFAASGGPVAAPGTAANGIYADLRAVTAVAATPSKYTSAGATEDEHAVCTAACSLYSLIVTNTNAAVRYIRCENDTAANTTPGSETPELDLAIPGAATGAGFSLPIPIGGVRFTAGLTCWLVTGAADTDVAEVAANEIKVWYAILQ